MDANSAVERSFAVAQRALELMKSYGLAAFPRSYEVWYTFVNGSKPPVNEALKKLTAKKTTLTEDDIDEIYNAHLSQNKFASQAEKTSVSVLGEIDHIMEMIDMALGSTRQYGESLNDISKDLDGNIDRNRIREIVASLVTATKDVNATNRTLEARLKETKNEIEGLRETLESVRVDSLTDSLTGIANRRHFEEMLLKSIDHAVVQKTPLALIVIDVDHFKKFNDMYGHLTGDHVLRLVGMSMREHVKTKATLARFGGEEFGIILPETTMETARHCAEQIRLSVMSRELVKKSTGESLGKVTISVGVSLFRRGDTAMSLLERADHCMYAAKRNGRNQTICDDDPLMNSDLNHVA